jgi:uncharacterized membrane protein YhaH (DUF805 family)
MSIESPICGLLQCFREVAIEQFLTPAGRPESSDDHYLTLTAMNFVICRINTRKLWTLPLLFNREATPWPGFVLTVHRHLNQAREHVVHWYLQALRKYADFGGRAQRAEYWIPFLINVVLAFVLLFIDWAIGARNILYGLFVLAWICPGTAMGVRRLHDTGRSGRWMLISLIPVGAIALLVLLALEGEAGANQFGPDPRTELVNG